MANDYFRTVSINTDPNLAGITSMAKTIIPEQTALDTIDSGVIDEVTVHIIEKSKCHQEVSLPFLELTV